MPLLDSQVSSSLNNCEQNIPEFNFPIIQISEVFQISVVFKVKNLCESLRHMVFSGYSIEKYLSKIA